MTKNKQSDDRFLMFIGDDKVVNGDNISECINKALDLKFYGEWEIWEFPISNEGPPVLVMEGSFIV
jgi:hypothetical protein